MADTVHRGISVRLDPEDHAFVHDPSRPVRDRAEHLMNAVTREGYEPLGQHWSTDRKVAEHFAHQYGGYHDGQTHVVFHATHPEPHEIEDDEGWRAEHEVNDMEDEVPIKRGADVEVHGVSWRPHSKPGTPEHPWNRHTLDEEQYHTASRPGGGIRFNHVSNGHGSVIEAVHPRHGKVGTLAYRGSRSADRALVLHSIRILGGHGGNGYASQLVDEMRRRHPGIPMTTRKTAADGWSFEHFQVGNSSSWRSMGGPKEDPRRHGLQYTVPEPGKVVFHHDGYQNAVENLRDRRGPEVADRMEKAVLDHHGATGTDSRAEEAARPAEPEKPKRRVYYHGTTVEGVTHILPASHHGGHVVFPQMTSREHAYATTNHDDAWTYAQKAWASTGKGRPRVYQVRPIGGHQHVEKDPSHDQHGRSRDNNEEDVRSRKGFEVVREMKWPKHMGDPQEWES